VALLAEVAGMSHEIGAFLAGVALANGPIALFLSEGLKFFRDFFLVLFFFTLGARLDFRVLHEIVLPASILAALLMVLKPAVYLWFFKRAGEAGRFSRELGVRMGQASEFSLIIALAAAAGGTISLRASQLIQVTTILTMIASSYAVVSFYPTPLGTRTSLKQD
jgi:Kef-type K+ transport system membrane component KefB